MKNKLSIKKAENHNTALDIKNETNYIDYNKEAYNQSARIYNKKEILKGTNPLFYEPWFKMIFKYFDLSKKNKCLELGAGTGQVAEYLYNHNFNITCVEYSEAMCEYLKTRIPYSNIIGANVLNVNFKQKEYDLVVAMAFIHCFKEEDLRIILNKVYNTLKDDGYFAICTTVHNESNEGYFEKEDYDNILRYRKKWEEEKLIKVLKQCGFAVIDKFYHSELNKLKRWVSFILKKIIITND